MKRQNLQIFGFGKTRKDVMNIAETNTTQKGVLRKKSGVTQGWWRRFRDRQGNLSLRREETTLHMFVWMP